MKQPKKLTRKQKVIVSKHGLNPKAYGCVQDTQLGFIIVNREDHKDVHKIEWS